MVGTGRMQWPLSGELSQYLTTHGTPDTSLRTLETDPWFGTRHYTLFDVFDSAWLLVYRSLFAALDSTYEHVRSHCLYHCTVTRTITAEAKVSQCSGRGNVSECVRV